MRLTAIVPALFVLVWFACSAVAQPALDTIAFGSCARERKEQPIWDEIIKTDPDLFLFIGDKGQLLTRQSVFLSDLR